MRGFLAIAVLAVGVLHATAAGQEWIKPKGIYVGKRFIILSAEVTHDVCDPGAPPEPAQLLVSFDEGKSWQKRAPEVEGSEFERVFENESGVWIAGEYVMEGPASQAFLLIPGGGTTPEWRKSVIYAGASEFEKIGFERGRLLAWIRHLHQGDDGEWTGPLYKYVSEDGGRHWRQIGRVKQLPGAKAGDFRQIVKQHRNWRLVEFENGSVNVEKRRGNLEEWRQISSFSAPRCANKELR
jgi:hypothetical protein